MSREDATILDKGLIQESGVLYSKEQTQTEVMFLNSFSEVLEEKYEPLGEWNLSAIDREFEIPYNVEKFKERYKNHFHNSKLYLALEEKLKICKNQCWDCHLCEKTYDLEPIDSMILFTN